MTSGLKANIRTFDGWPRVTLALTDHSIFNIYRFACSISARAKAAHQRVYSKGITSLTVLTRPNSHFYMYVFRREEHGHHLVDLLTFEASRLIQFHLTDYS